jgi:hypothetical protein
MIAAVRFVEIATAVIALIVSMRGINTELVAQLAHLRRRHPRSETLDRLEPQLVLPIDGLTVPSTNVVGVSSATGTGWALSSRYVELILRDGNFARQRLHRP